MHALKKNFGLALVSIGLVASTAFAREVHDSAELETLQSQLKAAAATSSLVCTTETKSDASEARVETYPISKANYFLNAINGGGGTFDVADIGNVKIVTFSYTMPRQESIGNPSGAYESTRSETYEFRKNGTVLSNVRATNSSLRSLYFPTRTNYISTRQVTNCDSKD